MASAVLGAAFRIPTPLALHKEPFEDSAAQQDSGKRLSSIEKRRRTWWSLFCLDTWASMTLGGATLGRWDPSTMDILPPGFDEDQSCEDIIVVT
ncbi:hypothetical protein ETB97_010454 [Aspergillus alliaceus]|uniref:Xylanolytic transcriptional activator regulatory domain-containing protein n=1 Tax=Petromyces alliaceus TaxID=209559 RepID=A0A8H6A9X9_PETAA|nr:hypothetical protein ETB97_010454 [Aspergillus burnettii]